MIRVMQMEDYDQVYALWSRIHGFGLRSVDDSREGIRRFLERNPTTSVVAEEDGRIVGAILCGHDGRRGCLYHVCVDEGYRMRGIGKAMVVAAMEALKAEKINKAWHPASSGLREGRRISCCVSSITGHDIDYTSWKNC